MKKLLYGLILLPLIEIAVVLLTGKVIGFFPTIFLIVITGLIGVYMIKWQGLRAVKDIQQQLMEGIPPGEAMINALFVFLGGVFLLLPGFVSDVLGLLLILKPTRKLFLPLFYFWMRKKLKNGQIILVQK